MTQSQFFRAVITGYLEQDENIMKYIDKYKERYEVQGKPRRRKSQILEKKGKETKKQFSLEKEEIELRPNEFVMLVSNQNEVRLNRF